MKSSSVIAFFTTLGFVRAADIGQSCVDESIQSPDTFTASCNIGDGSSTFQPATMGLNTCLEYDTASQTITWNVAPSGNFATACTGCVTYRVPDPVYGRFGITHPFMNCTCEGAAQQVAINLDLTGIANSFGTLKCGN